MRRNRASDRLLNIRALRGRSACSSVSPQLADGDMPISSTKDLIADRHMALLSISPVASLPSLASQGLSEAT